MYLAGHWTFVVFIFVGFSFAVAGVFDDPPDSGFIPSKTTAGIFDQDSSKSFDTAAGTTAGFEQNKNTAAVFPSQDSGGTFDGFNDPNAASTSTFNPGQSNRRYGREGLTIDEVVKSNGPPSESSEQRAIRELIIDRRKFMIQATTEERAAARASWKDDHTCSFADGTVYETEYCDTLSDAFASTGDFVNIVTVGNITIVEDTATAEMKAHVTGKIPVINYDVNFQAHSRDVYERQDDGEWKLKHRGVLDDNSGGALGIFKSTVIAVLRDSIFSAKHHYPAYSPLVVVGGSTVVGFLGLTIFGVWILRKRRSYMKIQTVSDVSHGHQRA